MDELFELRLRRGLEDLIEPVTGGYPQWESSPAAARVGVRGGHERWARVGRRPRLAWVLAAAALLLVLLAVIGIVGSRPETTDNTRPALLPAVLDPQQIAEEAPTLAIRHPAPLAPSGIEILSPDHGDYGMAILDADGETIWLLSDRGLAAFDPSKGSARTWTAADDPAFPRTRSGSIAKAASGGVWLVGDALRLFDGGTGFRDVVPAPGSVFAAAEAADGTLWAATAEGNLHHWDGATWTAQDAPWSSDEMWPSVMAVDASGGVWMGGNVTGVRRFDGTGWQTWLGADADPLADPAWSITPLSDGSVLVATGGGVARFDGTAWSIPVPRTGGLGSASSVGVGSDGTLWVAAADATTGAVSVARGGGDEWITWGPSDGLPDGQGWLTVTVLPTHDAAYLAAGGGLFRLDVDRWARAWPTTIATGPTWVTSLLPLSRDEAWAGDQDGLWHFANEAWTLEWAAPRPTDWLVNEIVSIDGTPWAATGEGVLRRDTEGWRVVDQRPARALAVGPDGVIWVAGSMGEDNLLWTLRPDEPGWVERNVPDPPQLRSIGTLAVGPDGTVWAGDNAMGLGGMARFDGTRWELVKPLGSGDQDQAAWEVAVTPGGDMWAVVNDAIARHDGSGWTTWSAGNGAVPVSGWDTLAIGPDGTVWGATRAGPARFDGTRWEVVGPAFQLEHIWVAPDGSVWSALPDGVARLTSE